jgi:hypothetical protein
VTTSDEIARAARAYVSARYALRGAAGASVMEYVSSVDECWHELTIAVGDHDPECCGCEHDPDVPYAPDWDLVGWIEQGQRATTEETKRDPA